MGICFQSPLLQTTPEKVLRNFFTGFPLQLFKPVLNENVCYQKKNQQYKLGNYITNITAVFSVALKALLITKHCSESLNPLQVNHRKLLQFSN